MEYNVCHVEIPIKNEKKAKEFYNNVFGWNIDFSMLENYGLLNKEVSIGFPLRKQDSDFGNLNKIYIKVNDIDSILKKVVDKGGSIKTEKSLISKEIGYSATFIDNFGNQIGLFSDK